jgi:chromosome segregation ATPase
MFGSYGDDAMTAMEQAYKSPITKLLRFFEASRDQWKKKHHEVKAELKLAHNQVRAVEKSRDMWRERAEESAQRVRQLEVELAEVKIQSWAAAER